MRGLDHSIMRYEKMFPLKKIIHQTDMMKRIHGVIQLLTIMFHAPLKLQLIGHYNMSVNVYAEELFEIKNSRESYNPIASYP